MDYFSKEPKPKNIGEGSLVIDFGEVEEDLDLSEVARFLDLCSFNSKTIE